MLNGVVMFFFFFFFFFASARPLRLTPYPLLPFSAQSCPLDLVRFLSVGTYPEQHPHTFAPYLGLRRVGRESRLFLSPTTPFHGFLSFKSTDPANKRGEPCEARFPKDLKDPLGNLSVPGAISPRVLITFDTLPPLLILSRFE